MIDLFARTARDIRPTSDAVAIAFFVATAIAAAIVLQIKQEQPVDSGLDRRVSSPSLLDLQAEAGQLAARSNGATDRTLEAMAREFVAHSSPQMTARLGTYLMHDHPEAGARRLAVFVLEQGALRWNSPNLLLRAGSEFASGRYARRDYGKAIRYLGHPVLRRSHPARFLLGKALLADDNAAREPQRAIGLIRDAAEAGYEPAIEYLSQLPRDGQS